MTKTFQPGDVLTAGDVNLFVQLDQLNPRTAASAAERDAIWGAPTSTTARLALQNRGAITIRTDTGTIERYYAAYDATTNPIGAVAAGWYRIAERSLPKRTITLNTGWSALVAPGGQAQLISGLVSLDGRVSGTAAAGTIIGVLPENMRPASQIVTSVYESGTGWHTLILNPSGAVDLFSKASAVGDVRLATCPPFPAA